MRKITTLAALLGAVGLITLFQNCTAPAEGDGESAMKKAAENLDFAYDGKLNQIAHMSCANLAEGSYNASAYFSYRAGAYDNNAVLGLSEDNGGIRLNEQFLNAVKNRSAEMKWGLLSESPANQATIPQLAIRPIGNLQAVQSASSSGSARANIEYQNMLEELGLSGISKKLTELPDGQRMKYLTNQTVGGSRMEGSLHFGTNETPAAFVRNGLNSDTLMLTLTYTDMKAATSIEYAARSEATVRPETSTANLNRQVYGRGYHLRFTKPNGSNAIYPVNQIQAITEQDLHDLSDRLGTWNCSELRFKIIRPADAAAQGCRMLPDDLAYPTSRKLMKVVRNMLKYEDWWVDYENKCIVPKNTSEPGCYGPNTIIQYDLSKECVVNPSTNNALVEKNKACLAYTTICYRTN